MLRRSRLLTLMAAAPSGLAAPPLAVRAQAPATVRIVLFPGETSATAYYAKELGYFARAGIAPDISEVSNGAAAAAAVAGGSMDIGFSNPLSVAQGHLRGLPFTALLAAALSRRNAPASNGLIVVAKSSPIKTAKDLNGKLFAVDVIGGLPHVSVRTWIDKNGGDSSSVHFVEMAFTQMQPALESGRIDASEINTAFDPNIGKPNDALRLLGNSYDAVGELFCSSCWFSTDDWVKNNPALASKFVAAMRDAAVWANGHHAESAVMLAPHIKETPAQIAASTRVTYATDISPALIQPVIDAAARYGMLKTVFPAAEMVAALK